MLIKKHESAGLKHYDSRVFIGYSNDLDIYENFAEYNKKCKILIVFDDMIANMLSNKKLRPISLKYFSEVRS